MTSETLSKPDHIYKGIILACISFACISAMSSLSKILVEDHHALEVGFYRYLFSGLFLIVFWTGAKLIKRDEAFKLKRVKKPVALFFRTIIGAGGLVMLFAATEYLSVSKTIALIFTSVLMTPIFAALFLKEKIGPHRWIAVIVGFAGAYIIINPQGGFHVIGVTLALGAALTHASVEVLLRYLKEESAFSVTFYFTWGGALMCLLFMPFVAQALSMTDLKLLILCGFLGSILQLCITFAFQYAPASLLAPFNYVKVLTAAVFDLLIWAYIPGAHVFLGAAIIIGAKCYMLYREKKIEPT